MRGPRTDWGKYYRSMIQAKFYFIDIYLLIRLCCIGIRHVDIYMSSVCRLGLVSMMLYAKNVLPTFSKKKIVINVAHTCFNSCASDVNQRQESNRIAENRNRKIPAD